ncbi:MAG: shikimate kinase, partial [Clostridia bacterium]|nr:shikimate kinase [Clostridia bacterium]
MRACFGLLGGRLAHSLSPQIHEMLCGYAYDLFELPEEQVAPFLEKREFDAINVTIPYKKNVMPFCTRLSDQAKRIGSVNTIRKEADGTLSGFNTDYFGFSYLLRRAGIEPEGKKALILGSGGSSVTVNAVLRDAGAREVRVISRTGEDNYQNLSRHADADIIVNTTPVGMFPQNGETPLSLDIFEHLEAVADIVYNPLKTALLLDAEARGLRCENGLSMLVAQAKAAAEIFLQTPISDTEIERVLDVLTRQTQNIVLIGMPGCGKSTAAARLGSLL